MKSIIGVPPSFYGSDQSKFITLLELNTSIGSKGGVGWVAAIILSNFGDYWLIPASFVATTMNAYLYPVTIPWIDLLIVYSKIYGEPTVGSNIINEFIDWS